MIYDFQRLYRDKKREIHEEGFEYGVPFPFSNSKDPDYVSDEWISFGHPLSLEYYPEIWRTIELEHSPKKQPTLALRYFIKIEEDYIPYMVRYRIPIAHHPGGYICKETLLYISNIEKILDKLKNIWAFISSPNLVYTDKYEEAHDMHLSQECYHLKKMIDNQRFCHMALNEQQISNNVYHDVMMIREFEHRRPIFFREHPFIGVNDYFRLKYQSSPMPVEVIRNNFHKSLLTFNDINYIPFNNEVSVLNEMRHVIDHLNNMLMTDLEIDYRFEGKHVKIDKIITAFDRFQLIVPGIEDTLDGLQTLGNSLLDIARNNLDDRVNRLIVKKTFGDEVQMVFCKNKKELNSFYCDLGLLGLSIPGAHAEIITDDK